MPSDSEPRVDTLANGFKTGKTTLADTEPHLLLEAISGSTILEIHLRCAENFDWSNASDGVLLNQAANEWLILPVSNVQTSLYVQRTGGSVDIEWYVLLR